MSQTPLFLLQSSGIIVTPPRSQAFRSAIRALQQGEDIKCFPYVYLSLPKEEQERRRTENQRANASSQMMTQACSISWLLDDVWEIASWQGHPGPETADFIAEFPELDAAFEAVYRYYFGSPTIVHDWIVPLHHHPELNELIVKTAITNAQHVDRSEFQNIQGASIAQLDTIPALAPRWASSLPHLFLELPHTNNTERTYYLRRDGQMAYVVSN